MYNHSLVVFSFRYSAGGSQISHPSDLCQARRSACVVKPNTTKNVLKNLYGKAQEQLSPSSPFLQAHIPPSTIKTYLLVCLPLQIEKLCVSHITKTASISKLLSLQQFRWNLLCILRNLLTIRVQYNFRHQGTMIPSTCYRRQVERRYKVHCMSYV